MSSLRHAGQLTGASHGSRTADHMRANFDPAARTLNGQGATLRAAEARREEMVAAGHTMGPVKRNEAKAYYFAVCAVCRQAMRVEGGKPTIYRDEYTQRESGAPSPCVPIQSRPLPSNDAQVRNATLASDADGTGG